MAISVPWLRDDGDVWVYDAACGQHNKIYYGLGTGYFYEASYGVGGPDVPWVESVGDHEHSTNFVSFVDLNGSGRPELTQLCDSGA